MTAFQEYWARVAKHLGLKVRIPFRVDLTDDRLTVPVLLEEFGGERGMLLVTSYKRIAAVTDQLVNAGFGYSCLDASPPRDLDEAEMTQIIKMLRDWGWSGNGEAPKWYGLGP